MLTITPLTQKPSRSLREFSVHAADDMAEAKLRATCQ